MREMEHDCSVGERRRESELSGKIYQLAPDSKSDDYDDESLHIISDDETVNEKSAPKIDDYDGIGDSDRYFNERDSALLSLISVASATSSFISAAERIDDSLRGECEY